MKFILHTPEDGYQINAYDARSVTVNQVRHEHSLIISKGCLLESWAPREPADLNAEHLQTILALKADLVLLGTGAALRFPPVELLLPFHQAGIGIEVMDTAAACRTYNVLLSENRNVAAGLIVPAG